MSWGGFAMDQFASRLRQNFCESQTGARPSRPQERPAGEESGAVQSDTAAESPAPGDGRTPSCRMTRQTLGLVLLNLAGALVIVGASYDLLVPSVPANLLAYLRVAGQLDSRFAQLDLAMLRAIGGCLLAVGITTLILTNGPVRRGERWARFTVAILVAVAELNNAYRMYPFHSPWYGPFAFALLAIAGAVLASPPRLAGGNTSNK